MNKELFASMGAQMRPSPEAQAALKERLAQAGPVKKPVPWRRYAVLAACLALVTAAVPLSRYWKWRKIVDNFQPGDAVNPLEPHSYVVADGGSAQTKDTASTGAAAVENGDGGDRDQDMAPGELAGSLLEAGFTQEDADAYLAGGWQMTWAKWWKFYHQSEESGNRTLEALLDFSREEGLAVNTGDLPSGAYVVDIPAQEIAVMAYQNLMAQFEKDYGPDAYPEWYGGAYIDGNGVLTVNIAEDYEPKDKGLFLRIQDWAGTDSVSFGSVKYGLGYLRNLQDRAFEVMSELGLAVGCGVNEETGQVELDLSDVTDEALLALAELDPEDDAILVRVGQTAAAEDAAAKETLASDDPGGYVHIPAPEENDVQPDHLPTAPDGAEYDLLPLEPSGVEDASPGE